MNVETHSASPSDLTVACAMSTGRWLFEAGFSRHCCRTDDERAGYDEAAQDVESLIDSLFSRRAVDES